MSLVMDWDVSTNFYTADEKALSVAAIAAGVKDESVHVERCEVTAAEPGAAAQKAWIVAKGEVKRQKKKLPRISRVVFCVARKEKEAAK